MEVSIAQINEWDGKFANRVGWKKCEFIWAYSFMNFAQNNHPTRLFCPTLLFGT